MKTIIIIGGSAEVGAGLTLWSNAIKVLRKLGEADSVISAGSKLKRSQIRANEEPRRKRTGYQLAKTV